jgi:hypothetical protein
VTSPRIAARRAPEARARLARRAGALLAAAGTLYGALLGLGVWLVGAPAPSGLPRAACVAGCLALSAALAPLWRRELDTETG